MDNFLEEIRQAETARSIKTTREYVGSGKITPAQPLSFKVFKPGMAFKFFVLCFVALIPVAVTIRLFQPKSLTNSEIGGIIVGLLCSLILIPQVVRQFFLNKGMNFIIRVEHTGISIDDTTYEWKTIYETAILIKTGGNTNYHYLIIALKNQSTYEPYDLTNFSSLNPLGFSMTLAKYIEYFKP